MHIKTTRRYYLTPVRMGLSKRLYKTSIGSQVEKGNPVHSWWEYKLVQSLSKTVWRFLKKLKIKLSYDLPIPLLGIFPKNTKTLIWKGTCTCMFIAALFPIAKIWKQPKCPSRMNWYRTCGIYIPYNEILSSHKKEWNIAICNKMDGPRGYHAKWNKSDRERQIPYDFTCMWNIKQTNKHKVETKQ